MATSTLDTSDPKTRAEQLVRAHTSLFSPNGDLERWSRLWADDISVEFPFAPEEGFPARVDGIAAWREMCAGIKAHLPDYEVHELEAHATEDPDTCFAEWRGVSRQANYDQRYMVRLETRGGKVTLYREYFNSAALAKGGMLR